MQTPFAGELVHAFSRSLWTELHACSSTVRKVSGTQLIEDLGMYQVCLPEKHFLQYRKKNSFVTGPSCQLNVAHYEPFFPCHLNLPVLPLGLMDTHSSQNGA